MIIRGWRVTRGIPSGSHVWFDLSCERVELFRIPPSEQQRDLAEVKISEGLAAEGEAGYLDKVVSVSEYEAEAGEYDQERFEQFSLLEEQDELPF